MENIIEFKDDFRFATTLIQETEDGTIGRGCKCVVMKSAEDQIDVCLHRSAGVCVTIDNNGKLSVELWVGEIGDNNQIYTLDETSRTWVKCNTL